jgi:hypothetical protein
VNLRRRHLASRMLIERMTAAIADFDALDALPGTS